MNKTEPAFRQRFISNIRKAINDADEASNLGHPGLIGRLREICVSQILLPLLPPEVKCGTGQLTDCKGNLSDEIDVILYAPGIFPPALFDEKNGIFPVESCLYTIEVKSCLRSKDVKAAVTNAQSVRDLHLLPTDYWSGKQGRIGQLSAYPINTLFAFSTDLSGEGKTEIEHYREHDATANDDSKVKAICVRGAGYWYHSSSNKDATWVKSDASRDYEEVIDFVSGISNTIPQLLSVKGRPKFGRYLSNERSCQDI
ncbi:DUF6602 domain-containing protein [Planctomycetota bacterium]